MGQFEAVVILKKEMKQLEDTLSGIKENLANEVTINRRTPQTRSELELGNLKGIEVEGLKKSSITVRQAKKWFNEARQGMKRTAIANSERSKTGFERANEKGKLKTVSITELQAKPEAEPKGSATFDKTEIHTNSLKISYFMCLHLIDH